MRAIVTIVLTVIAIICLILKKEYRGIIIGCYVGLMIVFGIFYNYRTIDNIIKFYKPYEQTFYQNEYIENGEYPDALLSVFFGDKTVYTKDDKYFLVLIEKEQKNWLYAYYHRNNPINFMRAMGAEVFDEKEFNYTFISDQNIADDFDNLGVANDMFRYCFMYAEQDEYVWNYFNFYWYYYEYLDDIYVFMETTPDSKGETPFTSDTLMVLWDTPKDHERENMYIMTKTYYDDNVISSDIY